MSRYVPPIVTPMKVGKPRIGAGPFRPPPWHDFLSPPINARPSWPARAPAREQEVDVAAALVQAGSESSRPVDADTCAAAESATGADLRGVRVHNGTASQAAAEGLDARAFTVGSDIHLGREALSSSAAERREILAHELVHAAQQGARPVALHGTLPVSHPSDQSEAVARTIAKEVARPRGPAFGASSPALGLRDRMRVAPVAPSIQRDITGKKVWPQGTFIINFKKHDAPSAGATAGENGSITFTPSATAPDSNDIRFFQIARTIDTTTGKQFNWVGKSEANRQKVMTKAGAATNVAGGFFVDEIFATLKPRTKAADPAVPSSYGAGFMPAGTSFGKKKGATIVPASLTDTPNFNAPLQFNLVSTARGETGIVYGTVLWGFETFNDKTGITKVKNEYHHFRISPGETFDEAERLYNEFFRNPGSSTAPKK